MSLRIKMEKAVVEEIGRQQCNVQSQKQIPEPFKHPRLPFAKAQIGYGKMAPCENGACNGDVVEHRIDIQDFRPAKPRKKAPARIYYVIGEDTLQKPSVFVRTTCVDYHSFRETVRVDDQMDHHCHYGS